MVKQGESPGSISTSLTILQERFVELQRVRERREQKELMMHFVRRDAGLLYLTFTDGIVRPKQSEFSVQHRCLVRQRRKSPEDGFLSLGSSSECNQGEFTVPPANKRPKHLTGQPGMSRTPDYVDVDTSLHL